MTDTVNTGARRLAQAFFALGLLSFFVAFATNIAPSTTGATTDLEYATSVGALVLFEVGLAVVGALFGLAGGYGRKAIAACLMLFLAVNVGWNSIEKVTAQATKGSTMLAQQNEDYRTARAAVGVLEKKLIAYAHIPPTSKLRDMLNKCGRCDMRANLELQLKSAISRDGYAHTLARAKEYAAAATPPTGGAASMLARLAGGDPELWTLWAAFARAFTIQFASPVLFALGGLCARPARPQLAQADEDKTSPGTPTQVGASVAHLPRPVSRPRLARARGSHGRAIKVGAQSGREQPTVHAIVTQVEKAGGMLETSTRALGEELGKHRRTIRNAINQAAQVGALIVTPTNKGTVLRLAQA